MDTKMKLTPRHQRFAELIVEGRSKTEAYRVSFNDNSSSARCKASRLATNVNIQNYIRELRENQKESSLMTLNEKRRVLAEMVRASIASILKDDGSVDLEAVKRLPAAVLKRFTMKERTDPHGNVTRTCSIVFADKLRAMILDSELSGVGEGSG